MLFVILEIIKKPIENWKYQLLNDFEAPAIQKFPIIGNIKEQLYEQGAAYASMTGSGSTLFGIFKKSKKPQFQLPDQCKIFDVRV